MGVLWCGIHVPHTPCPLHIGLALCQLHDRPCIEPYILVGEATDSSRQPDKVRSYGPLTLILWPPSSIILGTIVFRALGKPNSPSHAGAAPEQCGRSRFPKAMRFPPLLGHPPQKSQYRGAATPQVVYLGVTRQNVTDTHAHHHQDIAPEPCDHINTVC